ncbi:hypothetical protein MSAN_01303800 [Mycena sanguinolenta]|uniref:Uncharacterized protein n=1 Tax=Mycena sanguinolenta TaxID=230812 RepID=A0A8H6YEL9_9AGAR|nr:hypothetical protein MSAN_01303800 [Mycena sanguinolenta]
MTPDLLDTRSSDSEIRDRKTTPHTIHVNSHIGFVTKPNTEKHRRSFTGNQTLWGAEYAVTHLKLSLLALDTETVAGLTDCTEILPVITPLLARGPGRWRGNTGSSLTWGGNSALSVHDWLEFLASPCRNDSKIDEG